MPELPTPILSRYGSVESSAAAVLFIGGCLSYCDTPSSTVTLQSSIINKYIDWVRIVGLANQNGVTPALWLGLKRKELTNRLPEDLHSYLAMIYDLNRQRNQQIVEQALEALAALNRWGIQPVFMKGALSLLEGTLDIGSGMLTDIDIIVREDEIFEASEALRSLGYITLGTAARHAHAWTFHRSMALVTIDLHRNVGPQRGIIPTEIAMREAIARTCGASEFRGLSITHRVLLLIMNFGIFGRHYYDHEVPLRNLHDLAALCHHHADEIDWDMIARTAAAHGFINEAAAWGLQARCFLNAPVPSDLYQGIRAHAHLMRALLQLSRSRPDFTARHRATTAWTLNRFRMDYRYGCGTGGLSLQSARIRHVLGTLIRQGAEMFPQRGDRFADARLAGGGE
jgi:hypothetical protein